MCFDTAGVDALSSVAAATLDADDDLAIVAADFRDR